MKAKVNILAKPHPYIFFTLNPCNVVSLQSTLALALNTVFFAVNNLASNNKHSHTVLNHGKSEKKSSSSWRNVLL